MKYLFTILTTLVILTVILLPGPQVPESDIPSIDKLAHFGLFMGWTVAIIYEFGITQWFIALLAGLGFALSTEVIQIFIEGRTFDLIDLVADGVGVVAGILTARWFISLWKTIVGKFSK